MATGRKSRARKGVSGGATGARRGEMSSGRGELASDREGGASSNRMNGASGERGRGAGSVVPAEGAKAGASAGATELVGMDEAVALLKTTRPTF